MEEFSHLHHKYNHHLLKIATHWSSDTLHTTMTKNRTEDVRLSISNRHIDSERKTCLRLLDGQKSALKKHLSDLHQRRTQITHYSENNEDSILDSLRKMPKQLFRNIFLSQSNSSECLSQTSYLEDDADASGETRHKLRLNSNHRSMSEANLATADDTRTKSVNTRGGIKDVEKQTTCEFELRPLTVPSDRSRTKSDGLPCSKEDAKINRSLSHDEINHSRVDVLNSEEMGAGDAQSTTNSRPRAYSESMNCRPRRRSFIFPDSPFPAISKRSPSQSSNDSLSSLEDAKQPRTRRGSRGYATSPLVEDTTPRHSPVLRGSPPRSPNSSPGFSNNGHFMRNTSGTSPRRLLGRETKEKNSIHAHDQENCHLYDKETQSQNDREERKTPRNSRCKMTRKESVNADNENCNYSPERKEISSVSRQDKQHLTTNKHNFRRHSVGVTRVYNGGSPDRQRKSSLADARAKIQINSEKPRQLTVEHTRERRFSLPSLARKTMMQRRLDDKKPPNKSSSTENSDEGTTPARPPVFIIPTIILDLVADDTSEETENPHFENSIFIRGTSDVY